nr:DUF2855 family protein [Methylobacterium variabile]
MPTSEAVVLKPETVEGPRFVDLAPHRRDLPRTYNDYVWIDRGPDYDPSVADLHLVLRPLFSLALFLAAHLGTADFEPMERVVIASKTALALAFMLRRARPGLNLVGLTRAERVAALESLASYDRVIAYEDLRSLDGAVPTVFVDVAGDPEIVRRVHERVGATLRASIAVGFTRGMGDGSGGSENPPLPGPAPALFFTPTHILRFREEWGAGVLRDRLREAWGAYLTHVATM